MRNRIFYRHYLRCVVLLLSLALVGAVLTGPTFAYIVTQTSSLINTFISGLAPEGNLIIRKLVEHPFGENYTLPVDLQFMFWVELGPDYAGKTVETTQGTKKADGNGAFSVTVKPGTSVMVRGISAGTEVKVTEIQMTAGFQVKDGAISKTVRIAAKEDAVVSFVNTYTPAAVDPVNLTVTGIKNLEGRDWQEGDTYTFRLDYRYIENEGSPWIHLGTQTVIYDSTDPEFNRFDFTDFVQGMTFDHAGTYALRVSEVPGSIGGITYDDAISYFDVVIGDADMDGELEIQNVTGASNTVVTRDEMEDIYNVAVSFHNCYAPAGSAEVSIPIVKKLDDRSGQNKSPAGFVFELYDADGQLVKTSEATSAAGETSVKLVYDAGSAGQTYAYTLKEADNSESNNGMIYDKNEYLIQVSIVDNLDGTVSAVTDLTEVTFYNVYDPLDASVAISGTKTLTGRDMRAGEFAFNLYETNADFVTDQPVLTAVNNIEGSFCFDELHFDRVGTYYYVIQEDASAQLGGIIYDETEYFVTVTVTDDNGILTAVLFVTDAYGADAQIRFHNRYHPMGVYLPLSGKKVLHGMELTEGMFHFSLYETDEHYARRGEAIQSVSNDAQGTFTFSNLFYTDAGNYYYIIAEDDGQPLKDITYDDTVYCLSVAVTDDGNGQLTAAMTITELCGSRTEGIVFENTYTPKPSEPTEPTEPDKPDDPQSPTTGDRLSIRTFAVIGGASALLVLLVLLLYVYWDKRLRL